MPFLTANGIRHYYRLEGSENLPVLMFAHALGADHTLWDAQAAALQPYFRVLRYDLRGHGASGIPQGDASIEMLGRDALALAGGLGIEHFAFCGLSIGGMIGQWLAAHAPDRVWRVVLANTSSRFADPAPTEARRRAVLESGMAAVTEAVLSRWFLPEALAANPPYVATTRRILLANDPAGYAACAAAVRDLNQTALLAHIRIPVLLIAGDHDLSTPWNGHGDVLLREIAGARPVHLRTSHLSAVEQPHSFTAALLSFLLEAPADKSATGMATRRAVLGDAAVDRALATSTEFTSAFQELLTGCSWGSVWSRPGLDVRTRRLLTLAITAALGRWDEFRLHVRCGYQQELEPCDVEETLLQTAVYAGFPAANTAFRIAAEEAPGAKES